MASAAKTIRDLPHFRVSAMTRGEELVQLSGVLNKTANVKEGQCALLVPGSDMLIASGGQLTFQDRAAGTAIFRTSDMSIPEVAGLDLTYVDGVWEPYHVWMVALPTWKWIRTQLQAQDAIARAVDEERVSIVNVEEVRTWIEIKPKGKDCNLRRYYPVFPSGKTGSPPIGPDGVIEAGWNHSHCELCNTHVGAGTYGYVDPGEHWLCETCHTKYVLNHDLSFIQT